jgi:hypothetical protein
MDQCASTSGQRRLRINNADRPRIFLSFLCPEEQEVRYEEHRHYHWSYESGFGARSTRSCPRWTHRSWSGLENVIALGSSWDIRFILHSI